MVKLVDIAKKLNLSLTTVSRALNDYDDVRAATKELVARTARDMGYVVNRSARSLALRKNHLLGLLLYDDDQRQPRYQSITYEIIAGVRACIGATAYDIMIVPESFRTKKRESLRTVCASRGIDGIFILGIRTDDPMLAEIEKDLIPAVILDYPLAGKRMTSVESDNLRGCELAVNHLAAQGHQRIAFVNGYDQAAVSAVRRDGFLRAMKANALAADPALMRSGPFTEKGGYDAVRALLGEKRAFTALFAASDQIAIGAIAALRDAGRTVPADVAIVGFDDILQAEYSHPRLTTIRQRLFDLGYRGAEELHRIMEDPSHVPEKQVVDVELVIRESA